MGLLLGALRGWSPQLAPCSPFIQGLLGFLQGRKGLLGAIGAKRLFSEWRCCDRALPTAPSTAAAVGCVPLHAVLYMPSELVHLMTHSKRYLCA